MNSKCEVQSKTRCESHEPCVCIAGFPACGCQKKSVFLPRRSSQYHSLVPIPLPCPDTNPSSRYHSLVPVPLPRPDTLTRPDTTPSSRYHSLVPIPLHRPGTTPSSRYHSLVQIPIPRPDTTPSGHTIQCPLLYASRPCSRRPTGGDVLSQVVYIFSERDTALLPLRCCCCCCY